MIPVIEEDLMNNVVIEEQPTNTYGIKLTKDEMGGYIDNLEAMKQAVYHIINTERYNHIIYSWNYGVELADLFGKPITYCYPEIKRRLKEALLQDERITDVNEFEFEYKCGDVSVTFNVVTKYGEFKAEREVNIN